MYYSVKHKVDFAKERDFLDSILRSNGVEDVDRFLNVCYSDTYDPMLFDNMEQAVTLLYDVVQQDNPKIYVQIDSDVDGYTSSCAFIKFVRNNYPHVQIEYKVSTEKSHGMKLEYIKDVEGVNLVVIPDAGSSDVQVCKEIKETLHIPVLILDHHEYDAAAISPYSTVVNCRDGHYPNSTLSGVGVVYKFLLGYCRTYSLDESCADEFLDLVALGMIADGMDLRSLETRYYVLEGLKPEHQKNTFLLALTQRFESEFQLGHTIKNYGWTLAPNINAMVRYGSAEEQRDTIRAMLGEEETREYQPKRKKASDPKPPIEYHSLQQTMARVCCNCKGRQDSEVKRYVEKLTHKIQEQKLDENSVIILDGSDVIKKNTVTGMIANRIASTYKRPTLIMRNHSTDTFGGSGRAYGKGDLQDFRGFLEKTNLFIKCAGHPGAFGIEINKQNISALTDICNEKINKNDLVNVYEVDYEIPAADLNINDVRKVANSYWIWGGMVDEPHFVITNLEIPAKEILGFSKGDSSYVGFIKFKYNGVDFTKKYCAKSDFAAMTLHDTHSFGVSKKMLSLTIIGTFGLSEFEGERYPQVVIQAFESKEITRNSHPSIDSVTATKDSLVDDFVF